MPLLQSWKRKIGYAKEVTQGTALAATDFVPFTTHPKFEDVPTMIRDQSGRGIRSLDQGVYQGTIHSTGSYETFYYPGVSGHYPFAMLGTDGITGPAAKTGTLAAGYAAGVTTFSYALVGGAAPVIGDTFMIDSGLLTEEAIVLTNVTGAGPYALTFLASKYAHLTGAAASSMWTHVMTLGNIPPSWCYSDWYSGPNEIQYPGMFYEKVGFKYTANGDFKITPALRGWPSATTTEPSEVYTSQSPVMAWQAILTLNTVLTPRLVSMQLDMAQPVALQYGANGLQSPNASTVGVLSVEGKLVFAIYDDTERNFFRTNQQIPLDLAFTTGAKTVTFHMSKINLMPPTAVDTGTSPYALLNANFVAVYNTTDTGPIKVTEVSTRATGY